MHWLLHLFGIDTQQSYAYDFWSGVAAQLPLPNWVLAVIWYRRHRCHRRGCARIGRHTDQGSTWCSKHRPSAPEL